MSVPRAARFHEARNRLLVLSRLLFAGHLRSLGGVLRKRLLSETVSLGLEREVSDTAPPSPLRAISLRRLEPEDVPAFTDVSAAGISDEERVPRIRAARLIGSGIETCYVATIGGEVAYMQYLIDASQNDKLAAAYGDAYPRLAPDEALLESAFSLERFRGRGLMLAVMPALVEEARRRGIRRLLTFVTLDNKPMLRVCEACGFVPFTLRRETYRLFRLRVVFEELPAAL
jgi:GNAT superfamily N-acetyltransferase